MTVKHISLQKLLKNVWQAIQLCDMCMLLTNLPPKCWIPKTCWAIDQQDCDSKEIPQSGLLLQKRLRQRSKTSFVKIQATACHRSHCVSQPEQHSTRWCREVVCICICKYMYLNEWNNCCLNLCISLSLVICIPGSNSIHDCISPSIESWS